MERAARFIGPRLLELLLGATARAALLAMREVGATPAGEITLACVSSAVYYFLPEVVKKFHARHPRIFGAG